MASKLENLLGESVIKANGDKVGTRTLCGKDKVVGIYFAAIWCSPCRLFTPTLMELYDKLKCVEKGSSLEIVFVSWDRNEEGFNEYFATMPWLAVPFEDRERKNKLVKKFRVQGIPRLVLLDGETGRVVTLDGFNHVSEDPQGLGFPWRRKPLYDILRGPLLHGSDQLDNIDSVKGRTLGLYFSAHWCPPCRHFTPELTRMYERLREEGKNFEVVFVSSDRSAESFQQYYSCMPWLALPFGDVRGAALKKHFGIDGIPTLVMVDEKGSLITVNGRPELLSDRNGLEFPWYPKPLNELTQNAALQLNESTCLVLFTDGEDEEIDQAREILKDVAEREHQKGEDQELFFFYAGDDEFCDQVRDFAHLEEASPLLTILDLPEQQVYVCPQSPSLSPAVATRFVDDFLAGSLTPRPLRPS